MSDLPKGWTRVALGEIATLNPKSTERPAKDELISFVPMAELHAERARTSRGTSRPFGDVSKGYRLFRNADILVAKITPCFQNNKIGQAAIEHPVGVGSTEFYVVRALEETADPRYLLHFLRQDWIREDGERKMTGSGGQRRVPQEFLENLVVPLPPLEEQRRIATILDRAASLQEARRNKSGRLDALTQAIFRRTLSNQSFERRPLGEVVNIRSSLVQPDLTKMGALPHIGPDSLASGRGQISGWRTIAADGVTSGKYQFHRGDVLYSKIRPYLNKVAVAEFEGLCSADMYALVPRPEEALPTFIEHTLRSQEFLSYADSVSNRANIPKVNRKQLEAFPAIVPPMAVQHAFNQRVAQVKAQKALEREAAESEGALISSLQSRAFRGEL